MRNANRSGTLHPSAGGGNVIQPVARQRTAGRDDGGERTARTHYAGHQRVAARNRSGALSVSDVIYFPRHRHNGIGLTGQRLCSWHRADRGIGGINAVPTGAHSGKGKDFGGIAANGGRFKGKNLVAKAGAEHQRAHGHRAQRPGLSCRHRAFNRPTHRLGARRGQRADVNQQGIGNPGKLLSFFGLNHHRRGCAKRQQHVSREGLYDIVGHAMGKRRTGTEMM